MNNKHLQRPSCLGMSTWGCEDGGPSRWERSVQGCPPWWWGRWPGTPGTGGPAALGDLWVLWEQTPSPESCLPPSHPLRLTTAWRSERKNINQGSWKLTVDCNFIFLHFRCPLLNKYKGIGSFFFKTHLRVLVLVAPSFPALCEPMDCTPPGSSVHGILQARILDE